MRRASDPDSATHEHLLPSEIAFHQVFRREVEAISKRRKENNRPPVKLEQEDVQRDGKPVLRPAPGSNLVGLALSGGGIRSAAFCLGVLQALNEAGLLKKIDYLSTVSGGGYIGTSMTAAMSATDDHAFPFASELRTNEPAGLQHIRDHSNYLFPRGALNVFSNIVVYLRGVLANVVLLLPWLLLAAAVTIRWNPNATGLTSPDSVSSPIGHFGFTLTGLLAFVILLALWSLWRSTPRGRNISDVGFGVQFFGILAALILVAAFCQLQPLLLGGMFQLRDGGGKEFLASATHTLKVVASVLAPLGAVLGFFGSFLASSLQRTIEKPGFSAAATAVGIRIAMYIAGAAVPVSLLVVYLYLSFWGIADCTGEGKCQEHTPAWLVTIAGWMPFYRGEVASLYLAGFIVLGLLGLLFEPNANSLHRLYRDRLGKAFLFDPTKRAKARLFPWSASDEGPEANPLLRHADLKSLEEMRVSELCTNSTPYHLINAALNIQSSKYANRRGRNADFFVFSPLFTGSEATGYVPTKAMERVATGLTLGAAMAVSGAAASANMGSGTITPLVPTLAILNIRLGYWLTNPSTIAGKRRPWLRRAFDQFYFLKELLGRLSTDSHRIYLTDGGHIENLGIYELLRRRCNLIIAVDAEADPEMSFGSLVKLERYARIDLGVRIDLPWAALRDTTRHATQEILATGGLPPRKALHGPHCALGTICYPSKRNEEKQESESQGLLLYVKSSLTGDENDYIVDYKRRNPSFPHESTIDQLFTEEQFEVYRALGFHAFNAAWELHDNVSMVALLDRWQGDGTTIQLEKEMRQTLSREEASKEHPV